MLTWHDANLLNYWFALGNEHDPDCMMGPNWHLPDFGEGEDI